MRKKDWLTLAAVFNVQDLNLLSVPFKKKGWNPSGLQLYNSRSHHDHPGQVPKAPMLAFATLHLCSLAAPGRVRRVVLMGTSSFRSTFRRRRHRYEKLPFSHQADKFIRSLT